MFNMKIVHLLGRYRHVCLASQELDFMIRNKTRRTINNGVLMLDSNPKTAPITFDHVYSYYISSAYTKSEIPIVIHRFPCTSQKNILDLNKYIDTKYPNAFEHYNILVVTPTLDTHLTYAKHTSGTTFSELYNLWGPDNEKYKITQLILKK